MVIILSFFYLVQDVDLLTSGQPVFTNKDEKSDVTPEIRKLLMVFVGRL
jgi:hypothetical protein